MISRQALPVLALPTIAQPDRRPTTHRPRPDQGPTASRFAPTADCRSRVLQLLNIEQTRQVQHGLTVAVIQEFVHIALPAFGPMHQHVFQFGQPRQVNF